MTKMWLLKEQNLSPYSINGQFIVICGEQVFSIASPEAPNKGIWAQVEKHEEQKENLEEKKKQKYHLQSHYLNASFINLDVIEAWDPIESQLNQFPLIHCTAFRRSTKQKNNHNWALFQYH